MLERLDRLKFLMKEAGLTDNLYSNSLDVPENFNPVINPQIPQMPKTPKGTALKLTNNTGKKKPNFISKSETKSPYNPN